MLDPVLNFAKVEVSTGYAAGATSIVLITNDGLKLPDPASGNYNLVFWDGTGWGDPSEDPLKEIVRVTGKSGDTLTVTRGTEGTADTNKNTALHTYKMILAFTKKMYDEIDTSITTTLPGLVTTHAGLTVAHGAVSTNTASKIVSRDASGDFAAGTITASLTGASSLNVLKAGDTMTGSLALPIVNKTSGYTTTASDYTITCDASSASFTITLPTAVGIAGRIYVIKKIDSSPYIVTIDGNGSETIDGATTQTINNQYEAIMIQSDNTNWMVI